MPTTYVVASCLLWHLAVSSTSTASIRYSAARASSPTVTSALDHSRRSCSLRQWSVGRGDDANQVDVVACEAGEEGLRRSDVAALVGSLGPGACRRFPLARVRMPANVNAILDCFQRSTSRCYF